MLGRQAVLPVHHRPLPLSTALQPLRAPPSGSAPLREALPDRPVAGGAAAAPRPAQEERGEGCLAAGGGAGHHGAVHSPADRATAPPSARGLSAPPGTARAGAARPAELTSPEAPDHRMPLVPIGAVEQHGPHLPLDTDVRIAEHLAHAAARDLPHRAAVAPALPYGASGEHRPFPGTLWLAVETVTAALLDLARAARPWAGHTVFVSGHGGNAEPASAALRVLRPEAPGSASAWFPRAGVLAAAGRTPDAHAGRTETAMLLAIAPE